MPTWGIHLHIAKKINKKLKIKDYNNFLIGNIITDINNGHVVKNISKIIEHKKTHYYAESEVKKCRINYDTEKFIKDNKQNLKDEVVLGYIIHLLTDEYWNNLTYKKHGLYNEKNEIIGISLNNGTNLIADMDTRRKIKQNDFKIFTNYLYNNNLIDIPVYDEKVYNKIKNIKQISLTRDDINKTINYLNEAKKGLKLDIADYKIFTLEEMQKNIDLCIEHIISYLKTHNINL